MRKELLDYLACADCGSAFELKTDDPDDAIISGEVLCPKCGTSYPIIRGILRYLDGIKTDADLRRVYADSFGHQWTTYQWLRDEDEAEFYAITELGPENFRNVKVLDAGCGGGRVARFVARDAEVFIGADLSIAVEKAAQLCADIPHAHFVQCDVRRMPLRRAFFDVVYSHGVLHHTPNTKASFDNLPSLVKPGGILYVALFRATFPPLRLSDGLIRSVVSRLPISAVDRFCDALAHLHRMPNASNVKRFFWFSLQATHEIRKCCLYDWYAPRFHHEHTVTEVMQWFRDAGFPDVRYINAWPYCPANEKHAIPGWRQSFRLGQLLGCIGTRSRTGHEADVEHGAHLLKL